MRRICKLIVALLVLITAVSCDAFNAITSDRVVSQGAPYELLVVCNQQEWEGALGDSLRTVLSDEVPYLQQAEPYFDVVRIQERDFVNVVVRHRNILRCLVNPSADSTWMAVQYDVNATPQIILTLQGPTAKDMANYVGTNGEAIVSVIERAERDRDIAYARKYNVASLSTLIRETFNFDMKIPNGYKHRNNTDDFVWISNEFPLASQGVVITKGKVETDIEIEELMLERMVERRNAAAAQIPGPSEGSYMTTYLEIEPEHRIYRLNGRLWGEMRGFWTVKGDFMGGPFITYATIDERTDEVIMIDCYVYSPDQPKRNYMHGVQNLIYGVSFDQAVIDAAAAEAAKRAIPQ